MKTDNPALTKKNNKQRLEMINFFYHHFVMNYNLKQTQKFFISKKQFTFYQQETISFIFQHFDQIVQLISTNLSNQWSFNEISHFEKATLIVAVGEFFGQKVPKKIIINEAINHVQTFSNFQSYGYVNKVLDIILTKTPADFFNQTK